MRSIKSLLLALFASLAFIFALRNSAYAEGIYSAADAAQMFKMSISNWNTNVMAVQTQGSMRLVTPRTAMGWLYRRLTVFDRTA